MGHHRGATADNTGTRSPRRLVAIAAAAPFVVFLAIYLPASGHGFVQDDYAWVLNSQVHGPADVARLFLSDNGFYRPVVALTFAFDGWLWGPSPRGSGLTNILLALACAVLVAGLARGLRLSRGAALAAAALWLLNFQGIRTAVLWISGRTALMLIAASAAAAIAVVHQRLLPAFVCLLLALFAKEEAVVLPFILGGWAFLLRLESVRSRAWTWIAAAAVAEVLYFAARSSTSAMLPGTAPPYYRLSLDPLLIGTNLLEYADKILTTPLLLLVGAAAILRLPRGILDKATRHVIMLGTIWIAGGLALTALVPARSDLYACFPSIGACLAVAYVCGRAWHAAPPSRQRMALSAVLVALVALSPIYYLRTERRVATSRFASATLSDLVIATVALPAQSRVVIIDDAAARASNRPNMTDAFGTLLGEAYRLRTGRDLQFTIVQAPAAVTTQTDGNPAPDLRLALVDGVLRPVRD